jgi:hypothetical protein
VGRERAAQLVEARDVLLPPGAGTASSGSRSSGPVMNAAVISEERGAIRSREF